MLSEATRKEIEPQVREAVARLHTLNAAIDSGANADALRAHSLHLEKALGAMLPTLVLRLNADLISAAVLSAPR